MNVHILVTIIITTILQLNIVAQPTLPRLRKSMGVSAAELEGMQSCRREQQTENSGAEQRPSPRRPPRRRWPGWRGPQLWSSAQHEWHGETFIIASTVKYREPDPLICAVLCTMCTMRQCNKCKNGATTHLSQARVSHSVSASCCYLLPHPALQSSQQQVRIILISSQQ